jgi:hypothetical protein
MRLAGWSCAYRFVPLSKSISNAPSTTVMSSGIAGSQTHANGSPVADGAERRTKDSWPRPTPRDEENTNAFGVTTMPCACSGIRQGPSTRCRRPSWVSV